MLEVRSQSNRNHGHYNLLYSYFSSSTRLWDQSRVPLDLLPLHPRPFIAPKHKIQRTSKHRPHSSSNTGQVFCPVCKAEEVGGTKHRALRRSASYHKWGADHKYRRCRTTWQYSVSADAAGRARRGAWWSSRLCKNWGTSITRHDTEDSWWGIKTVGTRSIKRTYVDMFPLYTSIYEPFSNLSKRHHAQNGIPRLTINHTHKSTLE